MPSLLSEFWQYLKDAAPGGALNPETPKLGGLLNKGAAELAASLREYGKANKDAIDNPTWDNVKRAVDGNMAAAGMAPLGLTVWHGSPHKFSKFDMSKIGTGEGAQAYGRGLYMAETEDVAKRYRDTLTNFRPDHIEASLIKRGISPEMANTYAQFAAQKQGGPRAFDDFASVLNEKSPSPYIEQFRARMRQEMPKLKDELGAINGQLYKVDIPDEAVARMLDWDKPLSQQAPEVRAVLSQHIDYLKQNGGLLSKRLTNDPTGADILKVLEREKKYVGAEKWGTGGGEKFLHQQGIPGIRYLDGGSRSAGQGSSNYVLFSDDLPRILEINGKPTGEQPWRPGEWRGSATVPAMLGAGLLGAGGVAAQGGLLRDLFSDVPPEQERQNWLQRQVIPADYPRVGGVRG